MTKFILTRALHLQAAAEERRLEARLSKMREGQIAAVSEVVKTAEVARMTFVKNFIGFDDGQL